ncbi:histidinol-phosphate transaminase [Anaerosinus massiliensis]|uniref:histidinol-phosphate transaminase n=1 Tax=Massilibacillus massiliensis TaxID=1806837 RepID=UPI000AA69930|nr:histidinol-phosphate transaminase [Massilibacillus massiliensis]
MKYRVGLNELPTYDVSEQDWNIKLNANESNLNLPPLVEERVVNRLASIAFNRYPDTESDDLKDLLAQNFQVKPQNILLGNGSSEILEKLFFAFGGPDRSIVFPVPSFSMYKIYAHLSEAIAIPVELEEDYTLDPEKIITAAKENQAKLVVLCTPNNPTGNAIPLMDIERIAKNTDCPLAIDEAYVEFHGISAVQLLEKYPNIIIARTFSKAYGLAAARIGYMLANEEIIQMVSKSCMPYHINTLTLATAAIVYQMRDEFVPRIQMYVAERKRMAEQLSKLAGITVYPSDTNFILIKYANAAALNAHLENLKIGIRSFGDAPRLENCLRITVGTREENDTWVKVLKDFIERG